MPTRREALPIRRRGQHGATTAEMGVTLVLFMVLVAGVVDAGRAVWARTTVQYASTQVVRWASVRSEDSGNPATAETIETWVENHARILDPDRLAVTTTWTPSNAPGATVSVTVAYDYQPMLDFLPIDSLTFTVTSSQIISY